MSEFDVWVLAFAAGGIVGILLFMEWFGGPPWGPDGPA